MTANLNSAKSKISTKIINPKKSFLKSIGPLYLQRIGYHQNAALNAHYHQLLFKLLSSILQKNFKNRTKFKCFVSRATSSH
jgi:hypothetical protein